MQVNLFWKGIEYNSLENCLVNTGDSGIDIRSTIIGSYQQILYEVKYRILANANWKNLLLDISYRHSNQLSRFVFERDEQNCWKLNGRPADAFKQCTDVDIPLTPFTNTLPVNRLALKPGEEKLVQVVYVDVLEQQIRPVSQKYRRLSQHEYLYQNVPNDFEATILVDEMGYVVDYPGLFRREALLASNYDWPR